MRHFRKTLSGVRNFCNRDVGIENFFIFIKYLRNNPKLPFSDLYTSRVQGMQTRTQKAFLSVQLIMNISKTLFYSLNPKGVRLVSGLRLG